MRGAGRRRVRGADRDPRGARRCAARVRDAGHHHHLSVLPRRHAVSRRAALEPPGARGLRGDRLGGQSAGSAARLQRHGAGSRQHGRRGGVLQPGEGQSRELSRGAAAGRDGGARRAHGHLQPPHVRRTRRGAVGPGGARTGAARDAARRHRLLQAIQRPLRAPGRGRDAAARGRGARSLCTPAARFHRALRRRGVCDAAVRRRSRVRQRRGAAHAFRDRSAGHSPRTFERRALAHRQRRRAPACGR